MSHDVVEAPEAGERRFNLGDVMVLIVAVALWLAVFRFGFELLAKAVREIPFEKLRTWNDWRGFLFGRNAFAVSFAFVTNAAAMNLLTMLMPAVVILRLRRPRPAWRMLWSQPGFVGCVVPTAIIVATLPLNGLMMEMPEMPGWLERLLMGMPYVMMASVPVSWVVLAARGRWRPEKSWVDRLGRVVAGLWCVSGLAHMVLIRLLY